MEYIQPILGSIKNIEEKTSILTVRVETLVENVVVTRIELPNGEKQEGDFASYLVKEEGTYFFLVYFEESVGEERVEHQEKVMCEVENLTGEDVEEVNKEVEEQEINSNQVSTKSVMKSIGVLTGIAVEIGGLLFLGVGINRKKRG